MVWRRRLAGARVHPLLRGRTRDEVHEYTQAVPPHLNALVDRVARGSDHARALLVHLAVQIVMNRLGLDGELPIVCPRWAHAGSSSSGDGHVWLRPQLSEDMRIADALEALRVEAQTAMRHAEIDADAIVESLEHVGAVERGALEQLGVRVSEVQATPLPDTLALAIEFEARLWVRVRTRGVHPGPAWALVGRMLIEALTQICAAKGGDRSLAEIDVIDAEQRQRLLVELQGSAWELGSIQTLDAMVGETVRAQPQAIALVEHGRNGRRLSYAELWRRSHALAARLTAHVEPGQLVAIVPARRCELVVAMLASAIAGLGYVPIDRRLPDARIQFLLEDSCAALLLCPPELGRELGPTPRIELVETDAPADASAGEVDPRRAPRPEDPAVVIYTSGSTGAPKGVVLSHAQVVMKILSSAELLGFDARLRCILLAYFSSDASVYQVFITLAVGGTLILMDEDDQNDPRGFWASVAEHRPTLINCVPSFLHAMLEAVPEPPPRFADLALGGDLIPSALLGKARAQLDFDRIINFYGPSEATIDATTWLSTSAEVPAIVPIGRPSPGYRVHVLDARGRLAPEGVEGELHVAGFGVARGYLGRPDLSAASFTDDLFMPGDRMYRTGDLGRWNSAGELEFLGRRAGLVKLHGHRIETAEIELAIARLPGVASAIVMVEGERGRDVRLIAYYVPATRDEVELRAELRRELPEFMVPARLIGLARWPLTEHGKVDRARLGASKRARRVSGSLPTTARERELAAIWREVLELDELGVDEPFVSLGGTSLRAARLVTMIRARLGLDFGLRELVDHPTIAAQARLLDSRAPAADEPCAQPRPERLPLSRAQRGMWLQCSIDPSLLAVYVMCEAYRVTGPLELEALARALELVVGRHESLRTSIVVDAEGPRQEIRPPGPVPLRRVELGSSSSLAQIYAQERARPFELDAAPLLRATVVEDQRRACALLLSTHHIVSDGWSMRVLGRELAEAYRATVEGRAPELRPLAWQYADHALMHERWISSEAGRAAAASWRDALYQLPAPIELPLDHPRSPSRDPRGGQLLSPLDAELSAALARTAQAHEVTPFELFLAASAVFLHRHTGARSLVLGTPTANRLRPGADEQIGLYVNTVPIRVDIEPEQPFVALLAEVAARARSAWTRQELPFEDIVALAGTERDLAHHPLFDVLVEQLIDEDPLAWSGGPTTLARIEFDEGVSLYDLTFSVLIGACWTLRLTWATALFERDSAERFVARLERLLAAIIADVHVPVGRLELLPSTERQRLLDEFAADMVPDLVDDTLPALIEARCRAQPRVPAVVDGGRTLDYAELGVRASALAHSLREQLSIRPDSVVGLILRRSWRVPVAILAIMRAGASYLPLDPDAPVARLRALLELGEVVGLIAEPSLAVELRDVWPTIGVDAPGLAEQCPAAGPNDSGRDDSGPAPSDLAYLMLTSGSTGTPRAVLVEQSSIAVTARWRADYYGFGPHTRILQVAPVYFDSAVIDLFSALVGGATLVMLDDDRHADLDHLAERIRQGITHCMLVPSLYRELLEAEPDALARVAQIVLAGERVTPALVRAHQHRCPNVALFNEYGPAEASVCTTVRRIQVDEWPVLIGRPVWRHTVDILDAVGELAPLGVVGELCISGALARGYRGASERDAARFVAHPLRPGVRMYRSGDLGRFHAHGELEFIGRVDGQLKIHGIRVEPGEVEVALAELEQVEDCAVVAAEFLGDTRLVAHVVGPRIEQLTDLRVELGERLPRYMVPSHFVLHDRLPRNANGKLDRVKLATMTTPVELDDSDDPRERWSALELEIALIWEQALGVELRSRAVDFFALGGTSLAATRVAARLRRRLGVAVSVRELFEHQSVAALARALERRRRRSQAPIRPRPRSEAPDHPLSHSQRRMWIATKLARSPTAYTIVNAFRLARRLDASSLAASLVELQRCHEVLRTRFVVREGEPRQRVLAPAEASTLGFDVVDLRAEAGTLSSCIQTLASTSFDLSREAGFRARLVLDEGTSTLIVVVHHLACDGWSIDLLVHEWLALHDGRRLDPPPLQMADFAGWEAEWLLGPEAAQMLAYWRDRLAEPRARTELAGRPRERRRPGPGRLMRTRIPAPISAAVEQLGREQDASSYVVLTAGLVVMLHAATGSRDILIGFPIAGRSRPELERVVGCLVNAIPLRVAVEREAAFTELLAAVRCRVLEAQDNQDLPFDELVARLGITTPPGRSPLFDLGFTWEEPLAEQVLGHRASAHEVERLELEPLEVHVPAALWLYGHRQAGEFVLELAWDPAIYDDSTMQALLDGLVSIVSVATKDPRCSVTTLARASQATGRHDL